MDGIYDVLNFLTDDNLFTHQLPRAMKECEPTLRRYFPFLFPDDPEMEQFLRQLDEQLENLDTNDERTPIIAQWVEKVRLVHELPESIGIMSPMAKNDHERIDPIDELSDMIGEDKVIVIGHD